MKNEKLEVRSKKNCTDCLHCKVSSTSTKNCRLCFCSESNKKDFHKEIYFYYKPVCRKFEDMSA